jgi:hypothetical protein
MRMALPLFEIKKRWLFRLLARELPLSNNSQRL